MSVEKIVTDHEHTIRYQWRDTSPQDATPAGALKAAALYEHYDADFAEELRDAAQPPDKCANADGRNAVTGGLCGLCWDADA